MNKRMTDEEVDDAMRIGMRELTRCGQLPKRRRFVEGQRVRYMGSPMLGPPSLSIGTVALTIGARGQSVHRDQGGLMTYVKWDDMAPEDVYTSMLIEAARCNKCHRWLHPDGSGICGMCGGLIEAVPPLRDCQ